MAMPAIRRRWTAADVRDLIVENRAWSRYELLAWQPSTSAALEIDLDSLFSRVTRKARLQ
jgi:hypothetical protein